MKKSYKKPKMQVIKFECEDVITTSGGFTTDPDPVSPDIDAPVAGS